ncbi:MAG: RNA 3'-terminal phosphate cyclase [Halobacteriales archaeon]
MPTIDGSAGGGQILRSALTLAGITGAPVTVENVRSERPKPGLRPQHRAATGVLAELTGADVTGDTVGSTEVTLEPRDAPAGSVDIDLETAGSLPLLFETVLPLGVAATEPIRVTATGGTDVRWSPTIGYQRRVKVPMLERAGHDTAIAVKRSGFYPVGGGRATLAVRPAEPRPLKVVDRGELRQLEVYSKASEDLADADVAERQRDGLREALDAHATAIARTEVRYVETACPGTSVLLVARYEGGVAGFDALGERGTPAEVVGAEAAEAFVAFDDGAGAVDHHLADQLLVPLALGGGVVSAPAMTDHVRTNAAVIEAFGVEVGVEGHPDGGALLRVDDPLEASTRSTV